MNRSPDASDLDGNTGAVSNADAISDANTEASEINFDGLVGPTHNYAGLAPGNLASRSNRNRTSNPRAAARQGLKKMRRLRLLGIPQAVLPPHPRPNLALLRHVGFSGNDRVILADARRHAPHLLAAAMSGSNMWTANAATVSPSADSDDGRVHFTPANLVASLHRSIECRDTSAVLKTVFHDQDRFVHHNALPASVDLGDEGAANHSRLCDRFGSPGVQLFVYGRSSDADSVNSPRRFSARQTRDASESVARLHRLARERVVFAQQHPAAIDAGVFHNDVIAVAHRQLLFCHETAFVDQPRVDQLLRDATGGHVRIVTIPADRLPLEDAVSSYLFNSQIVSGSNDETVLVAPDQCRRMPVVAGLLQELVEQSVFDRVEFVDVDQSMGNGGGPACLRLRVVLTRLEQSAIPQGVLLDELLETKLENWIDRHYRDQLCQDDLADPQLMLESDTAIDELTGILGIGPVFEFQT